MLQPFDKLRGCKLAASDGEIGEVSEFYFDDRQWTVRYLVVTTGSWLKGRHVLIAPGAFGEFDAQSGTLAVNLTQEQVRNSPPLDSDKPVSRQHESELHRHYGWEAKREDSELPPGVRRSAWPGDFGGFLRR